MKVEAAMRVIVTLLIGLGSAAQASENLSPWPARTPHLLLAEGGSERVIRNQQRLQALDTKPIRSEKNQRTIQMLKEQSAMPRKLGEALDGQQIQPEPI
jgi:hypothetical protein